MLSSATARSTWREATFPRLSAIFGLDLRSMALFRVFLGIIVIGDVLNRSLYLTAHYTDEGVVTRGLMVNSGLYNSAWLSVHMSSGSWIWISLLFLIHLIVAVMFLVGYRTRTSTFLLWAMCCSLQARNTLILHGGDVLMRMMLFFTMFLPLGKTYSLDCLLDEVMESRRGSLPPKQQSRSDTWLCNICTSAVLIQISCMYLFNYFHKSGEDWRLTYDAGFYALSLDYFRTWIGSLVVTLMPHFFLKLSTFAVLYFECVGWVLFFSPIKTEQVRLIGIGLFAIMHAVFGTSLAIGMFAWMTICALTILLPSYFWDHLLVPFLTTKQRSRITVYYNSSSTCMVWMVRIMQQFFFMSATQFLPYKLYINKSNSSLTMDEAMLEKHSTFYNKQQLLVIDEFGVEHEAYSAFISLLSYSPILWVLRYFCTWAWVRSCLLNLVSLAYHIEQGRENHRIASPSPSFLHRSNSSSSLPSNKGWRLPSKQTVAVVASNLFIGLCVAWVVLWCIAFFLDFASFYPPFYWYGLFLRLDQAWMMFSPQPPHADSYLQVIGRLKDGSVVDLYSNGALFSLEPQPLSLDPRDAASLPQHSKPPSFRSDIGAHRWAKLYEMMRTHKKSDDIQAAFARYICYQWNKKMDESGRRRERLLMLVIYDTYQDSNLDGIKGKPVPKLMYYQMCFAPGDLSHQDAWALLGFDFPDGSGSLFSESWAAIEAR